MHYHIISSTSNQGFTLALLLLNVLNSPIIVGAQITSSSSTSQSSPAFIPTTSSIVTTNVCPAATYSPTPGEQFALRGQGVYEYLYVQFDDRTKRLVLATLGLARFIHFQLDGQLGTLQNAHNPSEIVSSQLNSSFNDAVFGKESQSIRSELHGLYHSVHEQESFELPNSTDTSNSYSNTSNFLFYDDHGPWLFYRAGKSRIGGNRIRPVSFDLYILPARVPIPANSALSLVCLTPDRVARQARLTLTLSVESAPTTSTSTSSSLSIESSSLDAYDVLTQYDLENYCTRHLLYAPPVLTITSTSYTTSYYAAVTKISTVTRVHLAGNASTTTVIRDRRRNVAQAGGYDPIPNIPGLQNPLMSYSWEAIASACSRLISSRLSTSTTTITTEIPVLEATSSTFVSTEYAVSTIVPDAVRKVLWNVGYLTLSTADGENTRSSEYYGSYLITHSNDRSAGPDSCGRVLIRHREAEAQVYAAGYSKTYGAYELFIADQLSPRNCQMTFFGVPPASSWTNATKAALNLFNIEASSSLQSFLFQYNRTTGVVSPDYKKMGIGHGTFWACFPVPSIPGYYMLYYFSSRFSELGGFSVGLCKDTGLGHLRFM
ncbi:hypothetical protein TWF718_005105 [Orbilia javanica]|uniref:Uncharacterized protein n=1 Tax=Orbilia javanica TaxID=47235 RepID=A0AAN8RR45_9PEZI